MRQEAISDNNKTGKRGREKYYLTILIIVLGICSYFAYRVYAQENFYNNVKLQKVKTAVEKITHQEKDIFTEAYQKEAQKKIDEKKEKKDYTISSPLLISNPYGTNSTSIYYYGVSDRYSYVKCTIEADGAETITQTLKNDSKNNLTLQHEYQITGLVAGAKNKITMNFYDRENRAIAKTYFYVTTAADSEIPAITNVKEGSSSTKMSNGLFAILGHDKTEAANIYFYDNNGINRGKMPLNSYRTDRILTVNGKMIYSYDVNKIAMMNRIGKIVKTINLGQYELHHDFCYDENSGRILCLVNDTKKDTIEDVLISVDLKTNQVKKLIDFEDLLKEMRENAVQREGGKNTYGGTELDWLHLNSMDILDNGQIIVSSREQSALIKVSDIYENPKISYIIHSGTLYDGTAYEKYLLKQKGNFVGQAGQHTITVEYDNSLPEGQYYLYMFNNNFGNAATIPDFDWSKYPGVGEYAKGNSSYYYRYLVDEKKGTYQLVQKISLPYSSIVSSVQHLSGNITFSSGMSKSFGEYDKNGKLIRSFTYEADKYSYRVLKYNYKGFYYK
ncbi:aryl-sulfate sulfotransferase [Anaerostipes faecalis]|uniref:aryl-sulfate sulfotransferase n=1 Tax=Anaerostipes faecalis TaxID=2738446 RepID=UPI001C1DEB26|nr:aryl-sulfate sulfotransferase [Anaerostipes faecalis]